MKEFEERIYMLTSMTEEVHVKVYRLDPGPTSDFSNTFHKYGNQITT